MHRKSARFLRAGHGFGAGAENRTRWVVLLTFGYGARPGGAAVQAGEIELIGTAGLLTDGVGTVSLGVDLDHGVGLTGKFTVRNAGGAAPNFISDDQAPFDVHTDLEQRSALGSARLTGTRRPNKRFDRNVATGKEMTGTDHAPTCALGAFNRMKPDRYRTFSLVDMATGGEARRQSRALKIEPLTSVSEVAAMVGVADVGLIAFAGWRRLCQRQPGPSVT